MAIRSVPLNFPLSLTLATYSKLVRQTHGAGIRDVLSLRASGPDFYSQDDLSHRDPIFTPMTIFPFGTQFLLPGRSLPSGPNFYSRDVLSLRASGPNFYSRDVLSLRNQFSLPGRSFPSEPNFHSRDVRSLRDPSFTRVWKERLVATIWDRTFLIITMI
jgi:hypothetical protein